MAYQKIPPKLAQKLNGKGSSIAPAGGRSSFGRPKSPFRVPQIAHNSHGARASATPNSKMGPAVNYGSYGGSSYAAGNKNYKNYGNYRYNQVASRPGAGAEYAGNQINQIQSYENVDYQVYTDGDYYQEWVIILDDFGKSIIWFILEHGFIKWNLTVNLQEIIEIFQRFKMLIQVQIKL